MSIVGVVLFKNPGVCYCIKKEACLGVIVCSYRVIKIR